MICAWNIFCVKSSPKLSATAPTNIPCDRLEILLAGIRLSSCVLIEVDVPLRFMLPLLVVNVHPARHDMQVRPLYVLVFEHEIGLFAVPHFFHILLCDGGQFGIRQAVVGVRVQRYVEYGFAGISVGRHIRLEACHSVVHLLVVPVLENAVCEQ